MCLGRVVWSEVDGYSSASCIGDACTYNGDGLAPLPWYMMANSFRTHIQNYSESTLVRPLTALLGKNKPYEWSESCAQLEAFEKMRKAIADHAQLMWIDYSIPLVLRADANQEGVGAVLLKVKDGVEHPVVFLSETFSEVATRWSTLEQEAYAIYWAVMNLYQSRCWHYLLSKLGSYRQQEMH